AGWTGHTARLAGKAGTPTSEVAPAPAPDHRLARADNAGTPAPAGAPGGPAPALACYDPGPLRRGLRVTAAWGVAGRTAHQRTRGPHVANIRSQIKRNRQNERRRLRNKSVRSELRTRTSSAVAAAEAGAGDGPEALRQAIKRIDKAAAQGVIHKNQAANRKSRLMRRVAAAEAQSAG
ncbi:MAG TPA: 30S ribosomal protein S20, partial [Acidimicrobiales bacterium]|nr:30S ribosomal protein S20 [Acidimicrobiales bacterium]